MKVAQKKPAEELRMSSADFDRIMGQALQVKPEATKANASQKKRSNKKKTAKK